MDKSTQVLELFKRVQHPQLQETVKAIEVRTDLDGITYSESDNHLIATVSKMPGYYQNWKGRSKNIARPSSPHANKSAASIARMPERKRWQKPSVRSLNCPTPLSK